MTTIAWGSDLHLDHCTPHVRESLLNRVRTSSPEHLVVTGDISTAKSLGSDLRALARAASRPLRFVLGNHDQYGDTIGRTRDAVAQLGVEQPEIQWLPPAGVVMLDDRTALVGVDGWADGRHGDPLNTPLRLNDDRLIGELRQQPSRAARLRAKQALADADAARLTVLLERAIASAAGRIIVATHIPPFVEALPPAGHLAGPEWLPLLVSGATGVVLRRVARAHQERSFLVLCGHTHVAMDVMIVPNLRCMVAGARYGAPTINTVTV